MQPKREKILYDLSEKLGVELYVLEVGRKVFMPEQTGQGAYVATKPGGTLLWTQAACREQDKPLTWTHTHPGMGAFFSATDVSGAWRLRRTVTSDDTERSVKAVVLGQEGARYEVEINKDWTEKNPEPKVLEWKPEPRPITRYEGRADSKWDRPSWEPSYRGQWGGRYASHWYRDPQTGRLVQWQNNGVGMEFDDDSLYLQEELFQMHRPRMVPPLHDVGRQPLDDSKIGLWLQKPDQSWVFKTFKTLISKKGRKILDAMPDGQRVKVEAKIQEWVDEEEKEEMWKMVKLRHLLRSIERSVGREVMQEQLDAVGIIRLIRDGEEN